MAIQERDPRPYELMTVFVPELSEEDTQAQIDRIATYIGNAGGSVTETLTSSPWGRRRLAYTIRFNGVDYRDGFYTVYHFDSAPSNLTELERELKLDTGVMRYLLVHDDPKAGEQFTEGEGDEATEGGEPTTETSQPEATTPQPEVTAAQPEAAAASTATDESTETADQAPAENAPAEAEDAAAETGAEEAAAEIETADVAAATESSETEATGEPTESDDTSEKE